MTLENLTLADWVMVGNPDFLPVFHELLEGLSMDTGIAIMKELGAHFAALEAGEASPMTLVSAVPTMITLLHLIEGRPRFLSDQLLELWISEGEGGLRECLQCGYRLPCSILHCVLCGSETGPAGIFNQRRAAKAPLN
jgi:hypothetical protein